MAWPWPLRTKQTKIFKNNLPITTSTNATCPRTSTTTAHGRCLWPAGPTAGTVSPTPRARRIKTPSRRAARAQLSSQFSLVLALHSCTRPSLSLSRKRLKKRKKEGASSVCARVSLFLSRGLLACPIAGKLQGLVFQLQGQDLLSSESTSKQLRSEEPRRRGRGRRREVCGA
jgi:hypothetical protein